MYLENIPKRNNRTMKGKRIGRGYGSGVGGHTVGRGSKGQKSRTGHKSLVFFEGGNVAFFRRMPKYKGFNQSRKIENDAVNVNTLEKEFKAGEIVSVETLKEKGIIKKNSQGVKILGKGEIKIKINIDGVAVSAAAKEKIMKAGGTIK
ncbi:MAG: 50S ribosomal protein L15 [candidate division WS6 bacterium GW2011_GWC2_36_7]|uniref:Large ribosomal subunit protein uL15 n=1 Tax=candidate division WS6 bacterium GW2011_GWC2_36_7 TaxID=1619091 RepID=A0A0G0EVF2_9BACT|nr:MAG: 50S ribosomal protein L15 [candidate division WS6 bacterium GW2011_WS6_36_26]KKQ10913.1 MAG: 50S ribosomal protein L15 [candidate division WS6 bacterium GW2011_GWC2_36_7]HAM37660.1 50S ribosomal protein L15 [Patescibacteria group bacterium]HAM96786.1 50S ribosomal protein L15 [Patescibacteria group bacterium]